MQEAVLETQADPTFVAASLVRRGDEWFETRHQHPTGTGQVRVAHLFVNLHVMDDENTAVLAG